MKDVDFDRRVLVVRDGKGGKDQVVMLPQSLDVALRSQMALSRTVWERDRQQQQPGVQLPDALAVKYPGLGQRWGWFWVFAAPKLTRSRKLVWARTWRPQTAVMPSVRCPQYGSSKDLQGLGGFLSRIPYHLSAGRCPV